MSLLGASRGGPLRFGHKRSGFSRPVVSGYGVLLGAVIDTEWRIVSQSGDGLRLHLPHCPATWLCHTDLWRVAARVRPATTQMTAGQMTRLLVSDLLSGEDLIRSPSGQWSVAGDGAKKHQCGPRRAQSRRLAHGDELWEETFPGERWTGWLDLVVKEEMRDVLDTVLKRCDEIHTIDGDIMPVPPSAIADVPDDLSLELVVWVETSSR